MTEKVIDFKIGFRAQIHNLTESPAPFNLKDFPIPYWGPLKDQADAVKQIQTVIDWTAKKATDSARQGDRYEAGLLQEFGGIIRGALNFNKRTESTNLQGAMEGTVNKVIADEALRRAYPKLAPPLPIGPNKFQRLDGGSTILTDKNGTLVLNLKDPSSTEHDQVITAGSVTDAFEKATSYWTGAQYDPQRIAEFRALLPKSVVKQIDGGQVDIKKILAEVSDNRNIFAGGAPARRKRLLRAL